MDNAQFIDLDNRLFRRLHWGGLEAVTLVLEDGRRVRGQVLGIYRAGATGEAGGPLAGSIRLRLTDTQPVQELTISYDEISHIA